ncbi:hypothetical protein ACOMHN_018710 [Nucella lapillus]
MGYFHQMPTSEETAELAVLFKRLLTLEWPGVGKSSCWIEESKGGGSTPLDPTVGSLPLDPTVGGLPLDPTVGAYPWTPVGAYPLDPL